MISEAERIPGCCILRREKLLKEYMDFVIMASYTIPYI